MASCSTVPSGNCLIFNEAVGAIPGGYSMKAKGTEGEIYLYGDIGDSWFGDNVTAKQFADDLKALGDVKTIQVRINSLGGDVFQGQTIYRLLLDHAAKIIVHIDGVAASIASVIAMAGEEIHISEAAMVMIHNAWGIAFGSAEEMRKTADLLDKTTASIRDVYVARTGKPAAQITAWMDAETWFNGPEAVENGFATHLEENMKLAARFDPAIHRGIRNAPAALAQRSTPNLNAARQRLAAMKLKIISRQRAV